MASVAKKPKIAMWSFILLEAMQDPDKIVKKDEIVTVIRDCYPKAEIHVLVLPNQRLHSLREATRAHLPLLRHMHRVGEEFIMQHPSHNFLMGYHAEPSLSQLHLHIISTDFRSESLKNKKHWNSFNTEFFLSSASVIKNLEKNAEVVLPNPLVCKAWISQPMECRRCGVKLKSMAAVREHTRNH